MAAKKWQLRPGQEAFEVVDGVMAGRKFRSGTHYAEIPPAEKGRFEEVRPPKIEAKQEKQAGKTNIKKAGEVTENV